MIRVERVGLAVLLHPVDFWKQVDAVAQRRILLKRLNIVMQSFVSVKHDFLKPHLGPYQI